MLSPNPCLNFSTKMTNLCLPVVNRPNKPLYCQQKLLFFFFLTNFWPWYSIYLFIYSFMAVLGLRFCGRAFSSCGKWGPLFNAVRGPLIIVASLLRSTGSSRAGSVVVAHGPSCSVACGIFPDQGCNPCPLH